MTLASEIKRFARFYGIRLAYAKELFALYSRKPEGYRPLFAVESDAKTTKGSKLGWLTGIIYLAPGALSGHNVCTSASEECLKACLSFEGRARLFEAIMDARIAKTHLLFDDRARFIASMLHDAFRLLRSAARRRMRPAIRVNGTSDLPWLAWIVAEAFPFVQCYDYTKHPKPYQRTRSNYHLTFSYSGHNWAHCVDALAHGINVTVVFAGRTLPSTFRGYKVIDGDNAHGDLRFLDEPGVIVGLKAKGKSASKDVPAFIVDINSPFQILAA